MVELSVLVVDDEPVVAAGHAEYVQRVPGFALVGVAGSVADALRILGRVPVDLVLLDLNLPDGHGLDIVRRLRAGGHPADILTITAAREVDLVRAAVSLGVVSYLLKPFTFTDLRDRLHAYQRYRSGLDASTTANQSSVDAMFRELRRPSSRAALPKGFTREHLDAVITVLRGAEMPLSASEVAAAVGTSRVTARRYLHFLADSGQGVRASRLGGSGRPEVTFAWRG